MDYCKDLKREDFEFNNDYLIVTYWSAVSHPSQRATPVRHVSVTKCPWSHGKMVAINLLLTEREGRTGEYWSEVVAVRTERTVSKRLIATILPCDHVIY